MNHWFPFIYFDPIVAMQKRPLPAVDCEDAAGAALPPLQRVCDAESTATPGGFFLYLTLRVGNNPTLEEKGKIIIFKKYPKIGILYDGYVRFCLRRVVGLLQVYFFLPNARPCNNVIWRDVYFRDAWNCSAGLVEGSDLVSNNKYLQKIEAPMVGGSRETSLRIPWRLQIRNDWLFRPPKWFLCSDSSVLNLDMNGIMELRGWYMYNILYICTKLLNFCIVIKYVGDSLWIRHWSNVYNWYWSRK